MRGVVLLFLTAMLLYANCYERLFSLKAYTKGSKSIRIKDVLLDLSATCDLSVVFEDRESKRKIYNSLDFINIKDYTLDELLDFLLGENNLFYTLDKKKRVLKISYYKTRTFVIDYLNLSSMVSESKKSISFGVQGNNNSNTGGTTSNTLNNGTGSNSNNGTSNDYTTITTKSEFTFWHSLEAQLSTLLESENDRYTLFINKDASLITVTGSKRQLQKVKKFLNRLQQRMHKQVLIEAKLIEVSYNNSQTKGIDWSKFSLSLAASRESATLRQDGVGINTFSMPNYFLGYNFSAEGLFDFLKQYGDVKVLSNPKILTLNNQPAIINVGDQLSYRYQTGQTTTATTGGGTTTAYTIGQSFVGITLYVIPEITEDNKIIMKINPVTSELLQELNPNETRTLPPDMKIKQLTSIVKVNDGQKILIGGLISKKYSTTHNKVPLLGDMPVIGNVFHSVKKDKKRSELFILIAPKIIKDNDIPTIDDLKVFKGR